MTSLALKLLEVQKELVSVKKEHLNPHFGNRHMHIDDVIEALRPILNKHKLVVIQPLTSIEGKAAIATVVLDPETNEKLEIPAMPLPEHIDAQKIVAASTYLRRASLVSLFLIQGEEDDDGNKASFVAPFPNKAQPMSLDQINAKLEPKIHSDQTDALCPSCGTGVLREKKGKYGLFISCDNYPKCRYRPPS